jgi:hypothetical protein
VASVVERKKSFFAEIDKVENRGDLEKLNCLAKWGFLVNVTSSGIQRSHLVLRQNQSAAKNALAESVLFHFLAQ